MGYRQVAIIKIWNPEIVKKKFPKLFFFFWINFGNFSRNQNSFTEKNLWNRFVRKCCWCMKLTLLFIDKYNIFVTLSPFLIGFEKRRHSKLWKKYKLNWIKFLRKSFRKKPNLNPTNFPIPSKRDNSKSPYMYLQYIMNLKGCKLKHCEVNEWIHAYTQLITNNETGNQVYNMHLNRRSCLPQ